MPNLSVRDLAELLGVSMAPARMYLHRLDEMKLIARSGDGWKVTEQWDNLAAAFGISLTSLVNADHEIRLRPYFGRPSAQCKCDVFVAMPFRHDLRPIYDDHLVPILTDLKVTVKRADDIFSANSVMQDIWNGITAAKILIADCTGRNPNVFYEIGIAHTIGKPVVLITQSGDDVPFDLKAIKYIEYEYTPRGMKRFETILKKTVEEVLADISDDDEY